MVVYHPDAASGAAGKLELLGAEGVLSYPRLERAPGMSPSRA
jgi:hypothetical protein